MHKFLWTLKYPSRRRVLHARGCFLLTIFLMFLLLWWCMFIYFFQFNCFKYSYHELLIYFVEICSWFFLLLSWSIFNFKNLHVISIFFKIKNWFASSFDTNLNSSQIKSWSTSSLDADLNFSQIKNCSASSLDVDLNFS